MNDLCTYLIELHGQMGEDEINAMSPLSVSVEKTDVAATVLAICTDQSGLIGMIRYLHGLGLVFLSINRVERN